MDAIDSERIEKINKIARTLTDSRLASSHDEAVKMATNMVDKGEQSMKEIMDKGEDILPKITKKEEAEE